MKRLFFPLISLGLAGGSVLAIALGAPIASIPIAVTAVALALVMLAERLAPKEVKRPEEGETRADAAYAALTTVADSMSHAGLAALATLASRHMPHSLASELSLALALPLALLVAAFGDYWAHRLSHTMPWWWKLHAVHHAPHRMVALNNLRLHPVDLLLKNLFSLFPLLVLGFSPTVLAIAAGVKGVNVALQHANLDLRHGLLNYLFATNSVHRWHHSARAAEGNTNYGGVFVIFDLVFGTFYLPKEGRAPERMGLWDERQYPVHRVLRPLLAPLCWERCTRPSSRPAPQR